MADQYQEETLNCTYSLWNGLLCEQSLLIYYLIVVNFNKKNLMTNALLYKLDSFREPTLVMFYARSILNAYARLQQLTALS